MRLLLALPVVLLAACADTAPPPASALTGAPPPPPSRFDGNWVGTMTRVYADQRASCGPESFPINMRVAQGRARSALPGQGEARGTVLRDDTLILRGNLDAAERAIGRFTEDGFRARYQTRICAWEMRLTRAGTSD